MVVGRDILWNPTYKKERRCYYACHTVIRQIAAEAKLQIIDKCNICYLIIFLGGIFPSTQFGNLKMKVFLFLKKILLVIVNTVLFTVIMAGLILTLPKFAGIQPYMVLSGSMEPEIPTGGVVFTNTNLKQPEKDDIITYKVSDGSLVTHRVIKAGEEIVTQGDANVMADPPIKKEQVVGTVVFWLPYLGYALDFANHQGFYFILAALIILSVVLDTKAGKSGTVQNDKKTDERGEAGPPQSIKS